MVKLRIELWGLLDVFHKVSGDDDELFSLLKKSERWEVGKLFFDQASYWATLASFASTGDIVRLDFDNHLGELEKVKKEDATKIWEITGGILDGEAPLPEEERAAMEAIKIRIRQRAGEGYAKQGSNCEDCQQIIVDKRLRYYPASCESCSGWTPECNTFISLR